MTELDTKHPEGIEVAYEILRNAPLELLEDFLTCMDEVPYLRDSNAVQEMWEEAIDEWYNSLDKK